MGNFVELTFRNGGALDEVVMRDPEAARVRDCRGGGGPSFVTLEVEQGGVYFRAYLGPEIAESLTKQLVKLFPQEPAEFDPFAALDKVADFLKERRLSSPILATDEHLAMAVLSRACRLAEQDEEHNTLTEAGV